MIEYLYRKEALSHMPKKKKRDKLITIRVTEEEYRAIESYCHSFGYSKSKLIRKTLCQVLIFKPYAN